jgi:hypothetical protein
LKAYRLQFAISNPRDLPLQQVFQQSAFELLCAKGATAFGFQAVSEFLPAAEIDRWAVEFVAIPTVADFAIAGRLSDKSVADSYKLLPAI